MKMKGITYFLNHKRHDYKFIPKETYLEIFCGHCVNFANFAVKFINMQIKPKFGVDQLLFGMNQTDVKKIYGNPDKQFKDEDRNIIYLYNEQKIRLTFYEDEDFRLGYIIASHPEMILFDNKILGRKVSEVQKELEKQQFKTWEKEDFDSVENHFNEDHWLILQSEYDQIIKVEIGAIIKNQDEFDWKFGPK